MGLRAVLRRSRGRVTAILAQLIAPYLNGNHGRPAARRAAAARSADIASMLSPDGAVWRARTMGRRAHATRTPVQWTASKPRGRIGARVVHRAVQARRRAHARFPRRQRTVDSRAATCKRHNRVTMAHAQCTARFQRLVPGQCALNHAVTARSRAHGVSLIPRFMVARCARMCRRHAGATSSPAPAIASPALLAHGARARSLVDVGRSAVVALTWRHATAAWPVRIPLRRAHAALWHAQLTVLLNRSALNLARQRQLGNLQFQACRE